jgi:hypothetical protein
MNRGHRRKSGAGRVNPDATHVGIVIGARHVTVTRARVDQPNQLIRMQEATASFPIPRDHTLGLAQVRAGLLQCFGPRPEYEDRGCSVLLPSQVCDVRPAAGSMPIPPAWGAVEGSPSAVSRRHVLELTRRICGTGIPQPQVVTGIAYERFVIGSRYTMADPIGSITTQLDAHMHLFLADYGFAKGVLDLLGDFGLVADVLATPLSTLPAMLPQGESESDCVLVEVSHRHSGCGLFRRGVPVRLAEVAQGADDVLAGVAGRLGIDERTVARCLATKRDLLLDPSVYGTLVLPLGHGEGARVVRVGDVDAAVAAEAIPLVARIQGAIEDAERDSGFHPRKAIVLGDCPVLMRALAAAGSRLTSGRWIARDDPDWYRDPVDPTATDRTRMAGLLKQRVLAPLPAQPFLSAYYRVAFSPDVREAFDVMQGAGRKTAVLWRAARPRVRGVCERVTRVLARIAGPANPIRSGCTPAPAPPSASG